MDVKFARLRVQSKDCPYNHNGEKSDKNSYDSSNGGKRALVSLSLSAVRMSNQEYKNEWFQDCAASEHMSSYKEMFVNFSDLKVPTDIVIGDGTELKAVGRGDIELEAFDGQCWSEVILKDVLYVPEMSFNVFSVGLVLDKECTQSANSEISVFKDSC